MRRLFFLFLLLPFFAQSQTAVPIQMGSKYYRFKNGVRIDSALFLPRRDTGNNDPMLLAPGELIYRNIDSLLWYRQGSKMVPLATGGVVKKYTIDSTVSTISALSSLAGEAGSAVIVTDTLRGGLFYWTSTGTADNGVTFSGATGFWNRVLPGSWVDAAWWGAVGDGTTGSQQVSINSAIDYCTTHGVKQVKVRPGHYILNGSIRLKDNVHLEVDKTALMELIPGGNAYMITNDDLVNGNINIEISGGEWVGNGYQQTLNGTGGIPNYFLGFGFQFYLVKGLNVHDLQVDSTRTWAIAHIGCQYVTFKNIRLLQNLKISAENGDGITGSSSDVLIENISGYTNDDMVGVNATRVGFGSVGLPPPFYPVFDINNVTVRNVTAETFPGSATRTLRPIRIFANNTARITNVLVENIKGVCLANPINIDASDSSNTGDFNRGGYMENIQIRNISVEAGTNETGRQRGYIGIDKVVKINNLSISGITRRENNLSYYPTIGVSRSDIHNLDISNVEVIYPPGATGPFMRDSLSIVDNINLTNIYSSDSTFTAATPLYRKYASVASTATHINARNIRIVTTTTNGITTNNATQAKISLNSQDFRSDTILLRGQEHDQVIHLGVGPFYYLNGKWNNISEGAFIKNQIAEVQPANARINGVMSMRSLRLYNDTVFSTTNNTKLLIGFNPTVGSSSKVYPLQMTFFKDTVGGETIMDTTGGIFMARVHNNVITTNTAANGYGYTRSGTTLGSYLWAGADSLNGAVTGRISLTDPVARISAYAESNFLDQNSHTASIRFYTKALGSGGITERMRIAPTGNVGIGTTVPVAKLHVSGLAKSTRSLIGSIIDDNLTPLQSGITFSADNSTDKYGARIYADIGGSIAMQTAFLNHYGLSGLMNYNATAARTITKNVTYAATSGTMQLTATAGIHTGNILAGLQGNISAYNNAGVNGNYTDVAGLLLLYPYTGTTGSLSPYTGTITNYYGVYMDDQTVGGSIPLSNITNRWGIYQKGDSIKNYFAGSVGIGTITPTSRLHVNGSITGITELTTDSSNLMASTAWVKQQLYGTGGATPTWQQVTTAGATTTNPITVGSSSIAASIISDGPVNNATSRVSMRAGGTSRWLWSLNNTESGSNTGSDLAFNSRTDAGAALSTPLLIQRSTGNVGIGTINPGAKLEVAGQVKITGGSPVAGKLLTSDATGLGTWGYRTVMIVGATNSYTVVDGDYFIMMNGPVGSGTLTLPTASSYTGRELVITEVAGNTITFSTNIMKPGTGSVPTITNQTYHVISDGVQWRIISMYQ